MNTSGESQMAFSIGVQIASSAVAKYSSTRDYEQKDIHDVIILTTNVWIR